MSVDANDLVTVVEFIRAAGRGVVATVTASGRPEAALVGLAILDDGTMIFNSHEDARKIANLRSSEHVAIVAGTVGGISVQVEGIASVVEGDERDSFGAEYNRQFPGSRAQTSGFAVVVVRPVWIRVYDLTEMPPVVTETTVRAL